MGGWHGQSDETAKCLAYVPPDSTTSTAAPKQLLSPTEAAPWANSYNDHGPVYTWKKPVLPEDQPKPVVRERPPDAGPSAAGQGPDMRMQRGVKLGAFSDAKGVKDWPYFRDDVGLNRTVSETTKVWDTECGKVGKIPIPSEDVYRTSIEAAKSKQKCDLRREAQSFQPVPKGLERIYPRDTTDWPEPQYKPGVQLNHQLALHTAAAAKLTEPTAIGQTVTPYGGAMPNCGQLYANPAGTMAALSTGETHAPWWALSGGAPLEQ